MKRFIEWLKSGEEAHVILTLLFLTVVSVILSAILPFDSKFVAYAICAAVFFGLATIICVAVLICPNPFGEEQ